MWSDAVTVPLAAAVPARLRGPALVVVKALHTGIFATVAVLIALLVWDGAGGRPRGRTLVAGATVLLESAIYASNDQVCPLTPLARQLGAEHGAVADLFLPDWIGRRIPVVGGSAFVLGAGLSLSSWCRQRQRASAPLTVAAQGVAFSATCERRHPATRRPRLPVRSAPAATIPS